MPSTRILHQPYWDGEAWLCYDWCATTLRTDQDARRHYGSASYVDEKGKLLYFRPAPGEEGTA